MTALVEYLIRARFLEPRGDRPPDWIGNDVHSLLSEIEMVAVDQEIVSRVVLGANGGLPRVRCAARELDPTRHFATARRWQLQTPDGETVTVCSAACAVSWLCEQVPADVEQECLAATPTEAA